jgi:hypothetical protein|tara:strand:- start:9259 stop:9423 length:165 start_codon:yes stop_codon:yes gene_type:complete
MAARVEQIAPLRAKLPSPGGQEWRVKRATSIVTRRAETDCKAGSVELGDEAALA